MEIKFNTKIENPDELANIIGCDTSELGVELEKICSASFNEYIDMFQGTKAFKRGSDILEYRLFLLIKYYFNGQIPDEQSISRLFQSTASESRGYLRSIISKYQYQLKSAINDTIRNILSEAKITQDTGPYTITLNNTNIIEELNRKLVDIDGTLTSVAKKRGSVSTYEVTKSSYLKLCEDLSVTPVEYVKK
ncbi:hypothetical protein MMK73_004697 [Providencia rettgeri]|uniref:hypothetical protein n=1 Tax=Providencia sp. TaxID=589 RepID=UPI0024AAC9B4|nr:hypothetical protein [Providencia rettgeri]ELR5233701.1 hypothetical protein [Providencia rettgeri]